MLSPWLEAAKPIVRHVGLKLRRRLLSSNTRVPAKIKDDGGWVTEFDQAAEEYIVSELRECFPDHGILGEEGGLAGNTKHCWVIDPLDGTTNFIHHFPQCAVSLAYCRDGKPEIGIIYDIASDDLYTAIAGGGAYVNDERMRVSGETSFSNSLLIAGGQIDTAIMPLLTDMSKRCDGMRRLGTTALELAWVASGRADVLVSGPVQFWDVAAGALLVREAGGLLSDMDDNTEFVFGEKTASFVVGTPRIFTKTFSEVKSFCQNQNR